MFDFETPVDRRKTASLKWEHYTGRDVVPMWVADMDFASPPAVMEALHRRVDHGVFGYTLPPRELIGVMLEMLARDYDWSVREEWLVFLPGLVCGLNVTCRAVGVPGDAVVTFTPVYPPFLTAPRLSGRELVTVPLREAGSRWEMDLGALEAAITPRTRLLLLCSPHNPAGRVWTRDEQLALAEVAQRHDLIVCSDEIHAGLVLDAGLRHVPFAALSPELARRTITLHAPSKTYNVPGLGCAFAVIPDEALRRAFKGAMDGIVPHVNLLGYEAALAAYRDGEPWRQELLAVLRRNAARVHEAVPQLPGLRTWPVEATYLAWIDARGLDVSGSGGSMKPAAFFEAAGVGLSDGAPFGAPGFVRLNFGCPPSQLETALSRMRDALAV
ncbi:MAG: aspartate aminotransferase [Deltaproteobacteria bacterium HGW-Deltaproteobacteria-17]|nr:MAG: aspartate aminotransferase [Deltaproteobacteria bacterium HGW-Deltaproteobacteria-17]